MSAPLRIAVAGLGTVGAGTVRLLRENIELISERAGRPIELAAVSARDRSRDRGLDLAGAKWIADARQLAEIPDVEVVVELIGGADGTALELVAAALKNGRHVVTANKALIAQHGAALAREATRSGVVLAYEASVAGGIPAIKFIREGLAGNRVARVYGILNGTCNFILSSMRESKRDFAEVLAEAQALGYAEADPSFDIDGVDTAHKLAILTALAFGCEVNLAAVHVEGIRNVTALDIAFAEELGFRIKLLGIASSKNGKVEQRVHPCLVDLHAPIASVEGVFNAVVADGDAVGTIMAEGRGAGAGPTASAVIADLIDIARGTCLPSFGLPADKLRRLPTLPISERYGSNYIRLMVLDQPGVIADVAAVLRDEQISVESLLQHGRAPGGVVPVVITTHETKESATRRALEQIATLKTVIETPRMIRIESF